MSRLFFILFLASLVVGLSITILLLARRLLRFENVLCHFADKDCPPAITEQLALYHKRFFFTLPRARLISDLESTGLVAKVDLKIQPGTLEVFLTPTFTDIYLQTIFTSPDPTFSFLAEATSSSVLAPVTEVNAYLATQSGQVQALSANGVLNPSDQTSPLYLISPSLPSREYLLKIAQWLKALQPFNFKEAVYLFLPQIIIVADPTQPILLFNLTKDPTETLKALPNLLNLATMREVNLLDFRFNHPILRKHGQSR